MNDIRCNVTLLLFFSLLSLRCYSQFNEPHIGNLKVVLGTSPDVLKVYHSEPLYEPTNRSVSFFWLDDRDIFKQELEFKDLPQFQYQDKFSTTRKWCRLSQCEEAKKMVGRAFDFSQSEFNPEDSKAVAYYYKRIQGNLKNKEKVNLIAYRYNENKKGSITTIELYIITGSELLVVRNSFN